MVITEKRGIGDKGEEEAARHLESLGFRVIKRNYLRKWGELDIIAKKHGVLYFIEVKTITSNFHLQGTGWHRPEDNLHQRKMM